MTLLYTGVHRDIARVTDRLTWHCCILGCTGTLLGNRSAHMTLFHTGVHRDIAREIDRLT